MPQRGLGADLEQRKEAAVLKVAKRKVNVVRGVVQAPSNRQFQTTMTAVTVVQ